MPWRNRPVPQPVDSPALGSFKGVKRRFSYHICTENLVYIDDYAHHPTEINALYQAVTEMHPNKRIVAIFQPHLFSRTRDFMEAFAESLSQFDKVILLDIYPARELPIPGVTSNELLALVKATDKKLVRKEDLLEELVSERFEVVVSIGAGDIGEEVMKIKQLLELYVN